MITTPTPSPWQPIDENTPRDGTWIEVSNPIWLNGFDFIEIVQWKEGYWTTNEGHSYTVTLPTQWRPIIPAEPTEEEKCQCGMFNGEEILNGDDHPKWCPASKDYQTPKCFPAEPWKELTAEFKNKDAVEPAPVTGTPRTDAYFDFVLALQVAQERVRQSPSWHRFIDGTPLSNDIAVWIAQAYMEGADFARTLETELQNANLHGKTCVHHTDAERAEITCPVCLKNELDEAKVQYAHAENVWSDRINGARATLAETQAKLEDAEGNANAFAQDCTRHISAVTDLRAANASLEADLVTILTDVNYVGGVQHWIAKHAELAMANLDLATKLAAITKERDDARVAAKALLTEIDNYSEWDEGRFYLMEKSASTFPEFIEKLTNAIKEKS